VAHLYDYENAQTFNDPEPVQVKTYTRVELELLGDTNRPMPRCSLRVPGDADVVLCTP